MKYEEDFCIFIISHGRADNVKTTKLLERSNNKYPVYIIIDNMDEQKDKYIENFGEENVIIFDKEKMAEKTDAGDNFNNLRTTTYARNACFDIAEDLGYKYFVVFDDDYTRFSFAIDENFDYNVVDNYVLDITEIFDIYIDFLEKTEIKSVCFAQGGDFIGGENSGLFTKKVKRKAMNSFFCSTENRFDFFSRLNEDVNTYMRLGELGNIFLTPAWIRLQQEPTQKNEGGMSENYINEGTYIKSFYTVMYCPSFTKISQMGYSENRIHHRITWKNAVPKILREKHKKD